MARGRGRNERSSSLIWPGFVDAMTALLLVVMFVLSIFMIIQFVLREELTGKDRSLASLTSQLSALSKQLGLAEEGNNQQQQEIESLNELLTAERDRAENLSTALDIQRSQGEDLANELARKLGELSAAMNKLREQDAQLNETAMLLVALKEERDAVKNALANIQSETRENSEILSENASLKAQIAEIKRHLTEISGQEILDSSLTIEEQIAAMELAWNQKRAEAEETLILLAAAEAKNKELSAQAKMAAEKMTQEERLAAFAAATLHSQLNSERVLSEKNRLAVTLLNTQLRALRNELAQMQVLLGSSRSELQQAQAALEQSTQREAANLVEIAELGEKLNHALAEKVGELQQYRSEFFGKLREALGDRDDVRVVGDRFVFQSEVLFESGSADLGAAGNRELARFAAILKEISQVIPEELNWILRVDGHTDVVGLNPTSPYESNWQLSQARALSVVQFLVEEQGFPPHRLAATGFGEFQPIAAGRTPEALARNRRIELKLTER